MTLVFPLPAPANTRRGPSVWRTAARCAGLRLESGEDGERVMRHIVAARPGSCGGIFSAERIARMRSFRYPGITRARFWILADSGRRAGRIAWTHEEFPARCEHSQHRQQKPAEGAAAGIGHQDRDRSLVRRQRTVQGFVGERIHARELAVWSVLERAGSSVLQDHGAMSGLRQ